MNDQGQKAMLKLWLLITTNPNFLLLPAMRAVQSDIANNSPIGTTGFVPHADSTDVIQNWAALVALLAQNNSNAASFDQASLTALLTQVIQTRFMVNPDGSQGPSYASVLQNASFVFQELAVMLVTSWPRPSPKTMSETVGI